MKAAAVGLILYVMSNFGLILCICNAGIGNNRPGQIPVHELHQRIVALRGEEMLTLRFRYVPSGNVANVNLTFVQFYVDLERCDFDLALPIQLQTGFEVRFNSTGPVKEMSGNATIYGVPIE